MCLFGFKIRVHNERFFAQESSAEAVVYAFDLMSGFAGGFPAGFVSAGAGFDSLAGAGLDSLAGTGLTGSAFFSGAAGLGAAGAGFISSSAPFFLETLCSFGRFLFFM